jgi:putative nucleotidyltransferase with HDIG domain
MGHELSDKIPEYIKNMPSLPTSVTKVVEVCNDPRASPADLNRVISLDPVLIGKVLKLINSVYYGLGQQVTSLTRAIIMLGLNTVKNLVLSTSVVGNIETKQDFLGTPMYEFWQHSLSVGTASKLIAKKRGVELKNREEYFTAGLLHDIGKIPLNAVFPEEYMVAMANADQEKQNLCRAESKFLGINHCEVGYMISRAWRIEGAIQDVITHHHSVLEYDGPYRDILYTVAAADYFSGIMELGFAGNRYPENPGSSVWNYLNLEEKSLYNELVPQVSGEIEKASIFLKI